MASELRRIALDATYSVGDALSGVGVYSREMMWGLAEAHPEARFEWRYRPHRIFKSLRDRFPRNASRRLLRYAAVPKADIFHALNQRVEFPARAAKTPIVTTFHDLFVMTGDYSAPDFRARFAQQARRAAERSDLIIAVSAFTASQVRELLRPSAPVHVVHHGVAIPASPPEGEQRREDIVLHVGALQKRKNIVRLIQAFEALPESWKLVLAGSQSGYGGEEVLAAAKTSKAAKRIEVTGYVDDLRLEHLYRTARILAFPSLDEGFGLPVLEAMSRGLPVVASQGSALGEVAGDAAILVDPLKVESIAEALRTLAAVPSLRNTMREMGWRRAREFSWTRAVDATWACYLQAIARP